MIVPVEYSTGWELDGQPGTATPEGTIAFEVGADEKQIVYRPWSRIKMGIIASLIALAVILVAGLVEHRADLRPRRRAEQASPRA